jgi:hypothetical protein
MKAYKLFKLKNDKLFPLYIYTREETPIGVVLKAKNGEIKENGKVKSKLGDLAYRPGWHCCEFPLADHIGTRQSNGKLYQSLDTVWCEVEVSDTIDYTEKAKAVSRVSRDQYLKYIPKNGFYWYQTNPSAKIRWMISGEIKVIRILQQTEVEKICRDNGIEPQPVSKF